ncbi:MAG: hypothetical protein QXR97_05030 [Thermoproteota archaeon]
MNLFLIFKRTFVDFIKMKSSWIAFVILVVVSSLYFTVVLEYVEAFPNLIGLFIIYGLTPTMMMMPVMMSQNIFYKEKVQGQIEVLLTTPLNPKDLWLGKTIAITSLSYAITLLATIIGYSWAMFKLGHLIILSLPVLFHLFIVIPFLAISIAGITGLFQLMMHNPNIGLALGVITTTVLSNTVVLLSFFWQPSEEIFVMIYLALAVILAIINMRISIGLSRERIISR